MKHQKALQRTSGGTGNYLRPLFVLICALLVLPVFVKAAEGRNPSKVDLEKIFAGGVPQDVADLKAMQQRIQQLTDRVVASTVAVRVGPAQGSGVVISKDGYVLTAAHVAGRPNLDVTFTFPNGRRARGKTLGLNRFIDSGLMKITDDGDWPYVEMGDSAELAAGEWVLGTGHPEGYQRGRKPVLRWGRVLANRDSVIVTDVALVSGDSGGPLFDMDGKVIGIHSRIGGPLTANMHVPVKTYGDTWDRLAAGESWGFFPGSGPFIGVERNLDADDATISDVYPESPAARAGIKPGDVITMFDGKEVPDFTTLAQLVRSKRPGDRVRIEAKRDGAKVELAIVIGGAARP